MIYDRDPLTQFMTTAEQLEDSGQGQCQECGQWYSPTGEPFHPDCPARANNLKLTWKL